MRQLLIFLFIFTSLSGMTFASTPKSGVWRFELKYPETSVPFLMELEPGKKGWSAVLINGKERIELNEIRVQKGKWIIPLGTYQNYLEFSSISKNQIRGHFVKPNKTPEERVPLIGNTGYTRRFNDSSDKASIDLAGKWAMEIIETDGSKSQAIALFDQSGNRVNASIMTPTGDYRYIDGQIKGNSFETAAFDGVFNFVFKGTLTDGVITGVIAGKSVSKFTAKLDPKAALPDPMKQTQVEAFDFQFPDLEGKAVTLNDPRFKDKAVIVQISGSWCPNCMDETNFIAPWYTKTRPQNLEVVALSFERALSPEDANRNLKRVVARKNIPYTVLLAGTTSADTPALKLPSIKNFISFPTTIFLDRKHRVHKVHAGFNGPGTGLYYSEFQQAFFKTVEEITR